MAESLFEKQQNPVPGPLDADFHVLILAFGGDSALDPQTLIDCSQDFAAEADTVQRFYTDIPPKLQGSPEEIEHTIEVAVRRSFDFMKCPLILGGSAEMIPAVFRGITGQVGSFERVSIDEAAHYTGNSMVICMDGDSLKSGSDDSKVSLERVKAVVVTGSAEADPKRIIEEILSLCRKIQA